jgi:hypothetical protein
MELLCTAPPLQLYMVSCMKLYAGALPGCFFPCATHSNSTLSFLQCHCPARRLWCSTMVCIQRHDVRAALSDWRNAKHHSIQHVCLHSLQHRHLHMHTLASMVPRPGQLSWAMKSELGSTCTALPPYSAVPLYVALNPAQGSVIKAAGQGLDWAGCVAPARAAFLPANS